jgi:hypothetical protein
MTAATSVLSKGKCWYASRNQTWAVELSKQNQCEAVTFDVSNSLYVLGCPRQSSKTLNLHDCGGQSD